MPTKLEWQTAGGILLFLLMFLPCSLILDFLSKVRGTWSGKRDKLEPPDRSVIK